MSFAHPLSLLWLWLLVFFIVLYVYRLRQARKRLSSYIAPTHWQTMFEKLPYQKVWLQSVLLTLSLFLGILSLARPQWGEYWEDTRSRGIDIVIALDVSQSMLAQDVMPSRLERAKREIVDFLKIVRGDRVALVPFAAEAFLQVPLTTDYDVILQALRLIDANTIPRQGTQFYNAFQTAREALRRRESKAQAILFLTDGEDWDERWDEIVETAKTENIKLYALGIGTEKGAPIPLPEGGYKKDANGQLVFSRATADGLQRLTEATGGFWVWSTPDDSDIKRIYEDEILQDITAVEHQGGRVLMRHERFSWFIAVMVILLWIEHALRSWHLSGFTALIQKMRFWRLGSKVLKMGLVCSCLSFGLSFHSSAYGFSLFSQNYVAQKLLEQQKINEALEILEQEAVKNPKSPEAFYNLGVAYYKKGDFAKAEDAFIHAARLLGWNQSLAEASPRPTPESKSADAQNSKDSQNQENTKLAESLYNLGNSLFRQQRYSEAIRAWNHSLTYRKNQKHKETEHNIRVAENLLKNPTPTPTPQPSTLPTPTPQRSPSSEPSPTPQLSLTPTVSPQPFDNSKNASTPSPQPTPDSQASQSQSSLDAKIKKLDSVEDAAHSVWQKRFKEKVQTDKDSSHILNPKKDW